MNNSNCSPYVIIGRISGSSNATKCMHAEIGYSMKCFFASHFPPCDTASPFSRPSFAGRQTKAAYERPSAAVAEEAPLDRYVLLRNCCMTSSSTECSPGRTQSSDGRRRE